MTGFIKRRITGVYFSRELLYLLLAVLFYLAYYYVSFDHSVQQFTRKWLFNITVAGSLIKSYYNCIIWFLSSMFFLFLLPLLSLLILERKNFSDISGIRFKKPLFGIYVVIPFTLFMFVIILIAVRLFPSFKSYYPLAAVAPSSLKMFIPYEIAYFGYFLGWEFFYHSYLLFPYEKKFGKSGALLIGLTAFVAAHIGKPVPEVLGSIIAGLFLSILALETRTFWWGMIMHGIVALFMDIAVVYFSG